MPELPSLGNIPQAQFDRIVASFPGTTNAEKAQAYIDFSINNLIDRAERVEMSRSRRAIVASLPARRPDPPVDF